MNASASNFLKGMAVGMGIITILFLATTPRFNTTKAYERARAEWNVVQAQLYLQEVIEDEDYGM